MTHAHDDDVVVQFPNRGEQHDQAETVEIAETSAIADTAPARFTPPVPYERRPIVPTWLSTAEDRRTAARWAASYVGHSAAFHAVRTPVYAARLVWRAPVGLARALGAAGAWVLDLDTMPLVGSLVAAGDPHGHASVTAKRAERIKRRAITAGSVTGVAGIAEAVAAVQWPVSQWPLLAGAVAVAGYVGRRRDRPILDSPVEMSGPAPRLTANVVVAALGSLGISEINKAMARGGGGITFAAPITRDGPGWLAKVDLPLGVTAGDVIDKRDRLASGLRRPIGCVWPDAVHDAHAGRLAVWVADEDPSQARPVPWPLAKSGQVDLFAPIQWGVDPRGRRVEVTLMYGNVLIGSVPGAGKTASLRLLLLAAALDPTAELHTVELKGSGDLDPIAPVCHTYVSGAGDDAIEAALDALRAANLEVDRRAGVISGLPRSACPENKTTRELANQRRLGLYPYVLTLDECQQLFGHSDKEVRDEAAYLAERLIKLGRAFGVILLLATQRPDAKSLPTGVSANVSVRFALRVLDQTTNDMILGTSSYRAGIRATTLSPKDKGMGWLVGHADDATVLRCHYLDGPAAEAVIARARAAREAAGTLTGYAAGEVPEGTDAPGRRDLLADLVLALGVDDRAHSDVLCERLAELSPAYDGWTPTQLAAALKPHEISTRQVWAPCREDGSRKNRWGVVRDDLGNATR